MGLKGNLATVALADVFHVLSNGHSTGLLRINAPDGTRYVEIQDGTITLVSNAHRRVMLGDLLLVRNLINELQLQTALAKQKETGKKLGEVMVEMAMIKPADLEGVLKFQVEDEICDLFLIKNADFDFLASATLAADLAVGGGCLRVKIPPNSLLLEAARRADEWGKLEARIPSQAMLFRPTELGNQMLASGQGLSDEGMILLQLTRELRAVEFMTRKTCLGRLDVNTLLVELWDNNVVEPVPIGEYGTIAADKLEQNRTEEATLLTVFALKNDPANKPALEKLRGAIEAKSKLLSVQGSTEARARTETIRRPTPNALFLDQPKKSQKWLMPVAAAAVVLLAAVGYFMFRADPQQIEAEKNFREWSTQVEQTIAQKQYGEASQLLLKRPPSALIKERVDELADSTSKKIETALTDLSSRVQESTRRKDGDLQSLIVEAESFGELPSVSDRLKDELADTRAKLRTWREEQRLKQLASKFTEADRAETRESAAAALIAYQKLLQEDPPESMSAQIRQRMALLANRARQSAESLVSAKAWDEAGEFTRAHAAYQEAIKLCSGSPPAKEAERLDALSQDRYKKLFLQAEQAQILITQRKGVEARAMLEKLLAEKAGEEFRTRARDVLRGQDGSNEEAAAALAKSAKELDAGGKFADARQILNDLIAKYPLSSAAETAECSLKVSTQPPGADVEINGKIWNLPTPTTVKLPACGPVKIVLHKKGFRDYEKVGSNWRDESLTVKLEKNTVVIPRLLPAPVETLTALDGRFCGLSGTEILFGETSKPDAPLVREIWNRKAPAAAAQNTTPVPKPVSTETPGGEASDSKSTLKTAAVIAPCRNNEFECFVLLPRERLLRFNPKTNHFRSFTLAGRPLAAPLLYNWPDARPDPALGIPIGLSVLTEAGVESLQIDNPKVAFIAKGPTTAADKEHQSTLTPQLCYDGKRLISTGADGQLHGLNATTGDELWKAAPPPAYLAPFTVQPQNQSMGFLNAQGSMEIWDAEKGAKRDEKNLNGTPTGNLVPTSRGLIFLGPNGRVDLWDATRLDKCLWSKDALVKPAIPPLASDLYFLAVAETDRIVLIDLQAGMEVWSAPLPAPPSALATSGNKVYVATQDGYLRVFQTSE